MEGGDRFFRCSGFFTGVCLGIGVCGIERNCVFSIRNSMC